MMRMEPSPPQMMLPPTENSAAPVAADAVGAISSAFFSCSLNAVGRASDLSDQNNSPLGNAMRSGNSRCKIAKPDTANHWRACWSVPLISPGWRRMHFGIMGSPPPSFFLCSAAPCVHFTHMAMAAAPVKESDADARVSLTKHEKQWTADATADRCGSAVNPALLWLVSVWGPRSPFG